MGYIRTIALVSALFIAGSVFLTFAALAANSDTDDTMMLASGDKYEFLLIKIATPEFIEISVGDTVTWRNLQRPKFPVVLVSDDGLWNDETIYYGKIFSYTFNKPGTYKFSVENNPAMTGTIIVLEKKMLSVSDISGYDGKKAPEPVAMMDDASAGTGMMAPVREQLMIHRKEFLIVRTVTPSVLEVYAEDTVTWRNLQRPKFPVVLVSDEDLWDDETIYYGKIFSYTFDEPGTYTFSDKNNERLSGTVIVIEKKVKSVSDTTEEDITKVPEPVIMMTETTAGETRMKPVREETQQRTQEMSMTNEILMVRVATPEVIEIEAGDTVTWRNLQRPKFPVVLRSEDDLWDDQIIYYGKIFSYTFEESGTYTYSAKDNTAMSGTVIVN
jgi:plastocyanin